MFLQLKGLKKLYDGSKGLSHLDLEIEAGSFVTLLGPSGCGKTTTLHLLGGFLTPDAGQILLEGQDLVPLPPERRPVSTVFQSYALFPHLNVLENVSYGLRFFRRLKKREAAAAALEQLHAVGLEGYEHTPVSALSGGQQQRVALARAMATGPKILLLDEPLSALDGVIKESIKEKIKEIARGFKLTTVIVTHDPEEALTLSDKVMIVNKGGIAQFGRPEEIIGRPADRFVEEFILNQLVIKKNNIFSLFQREPAARVIMQAG